MRAASSSKPSTAGSKKNKKTQRRLGGANLERIGLERIIEAGMLCEVYRNEGPFQNRKPES